MTFPDVVISDRAALLQRSSTNTESIAHPLDKFIEWSLGREELCFVPNDTKVQPGVAFAHRVSGDTVWKAYPAGTGGIPKVEFVIRTLPPATREELRKRLVSGIGALSGGGRGVFAVALAGLKREEQIRGAITALEWALEQMESRTAG